MPAWPALAQPQTNSSAAGPKVVPAVADRQHSAETGLARRTDAPEAKPGACWIQLINGDRFSGRLLTDPLKLSLTTGQTNLASAELTCLTRANTGTVSVSLRNGETFSGKLASEQILVQLDLGPQVSIPGSNIVSLLKRALVPGVAAETVAEGSPLERMIWIPAGEFIMGSPPDEPGRDADEGPQTRVVIAKGFWLGKFEVTQAEYQNVVGNNPDAPTVDPARPVDKVSWYDALEYCKQLTRREEAAGRLPAGYVYRLPTEAEWEYACRAGSQTRFCYGEDPNESQLDAYAWFARNSDSTTHTVGTRRPNRWGLYDMHGNVWEWCLDRWEGGLPGGSITNVAVAARGSLRCARGGSWLYDPKSCRSANRDDYGPADRCSDIGFRVELAPVQTR